MAEVMDIGDLRVRATQALEPALWPFEPGRERHRIPGGGSSAILLSSGDKVTVTDVEGAQPAEVLAFDDQGRDDLSGLGLRPERPALGLQAVLSQGDESAERLAAALRSRGVGLATARCAGLFGPESKPGDSAAFTAERDLLLVVAAPGEPMAVDQHLPPSELIVLVERATRPERGAHRLPDPLADPRIDHNDSAGQRLGLRGQGR